MTASKSHYTSRNNSSVTQDKDDPRNNNASGIILPDRFWRRLPLKPELVFLICIVFVVARLGHSGMITNVDRPKEDIAIVPFAENPGIHGKRGGKSLSIPLVNNNIANSTKNNNTTLALLYPPGMIGGFRNQVLRFYSLIVRARKYNFSQILLPSILFTTEYNVVDDDGPDTVVANSRPIPMDLLFDADHWNRYSKHLPMLVDSVENSDCWSASPSLASSDRSGTLSGHGLSDHVKDYKNTIQDNGKGKVPSSWSQTVLTQLQFLTPIASASYKFAVGELPKEHLRQVDYMPQVEHCTNPSVYGSGTGQGRLWSDAMEAGRNTTVRQLVERWYLLALRPKLQWRQLAMKCVNHGTQQQQQQQHGDENSNDNNDYNNNNNYIALHARVELKMMGHLCGETMEQNLTKIFHMVGDWVNKNVDNENEGGNNDNKASSNSIRNVSGVFIAISRSGIKLPRVKRNGEKENNIYDLSRDNILALNRAVGNERVASSGLRIPPVGLDAGGHSKRIPIFECGAPWMNHYYTKINPDSMDYGSLLESIVNFYVATEALVFIGVRGSSFSNHVWATRYYQGKGNTNYEYTANHGIRPIENGGLPPPHANCKAVLK